MMKVITVKKYKNFCQMRIYNKLSFWPQGRKGWLRIQDSNQRLDKDAYDFQRFVSVVKSPLNFQE